MPGRFNYIKYDGHAIADQNRFKDLCTELEANMNTLESPRAKALALTKLEEVYMWIGKAIRDDQIARTGASEVQEERTDS